MKKFYVSILLTSNVLIFSAEIDHTVKNPSTISLLHKPLLIGNIKLNHHQLAQFSEQDLEELRRISEPSCISRYYGLDYQHIQQKDVETLKKILPKYSAIIPSLQIYVKNRNTRACSCNPDESLSCGYLDTFGRCAAFSTLGVVFLATIKPSLQGIMTYIGIGCLVSIPVGCLTTELANCAHYHYCTDEKKYEFKSKR